MPLDTVEASWRSGGLHPETTMCKVGDSICLSVAKVLGPSTPAVQQSSVQSAASPLLAGGGLGIGASSQLRAATEAKYKNLASVGDGLTTWGGTLQNIEPDFAAIITPGLHLAFVDQIPVELDGLTVLNERAKRTVRVCGPGAFVVLKALAFRNRGENKDAYDLFYVIRNFGSGARTVADHLRPLCDDPAAHVALGHLKEDFSEIDSVGPKRVADFLHGRPDDDLQADARGLVLDLLEALR